MKTQFGSAVLRDMPLKAIAIIIAVTIWVISVAEKDRSTPVPTFEMVIEARLAVKNVSDRLIVTRVPASVRLHVRGPKDVQSTVGDGVMAAIDLSGRGPGQHAVPVETALPSGVELVRLEPSRVSVSMEPVIMEDREVSLSISGLNSATISSISTRLSPRQVAIEGPSSAVSRVRRLVAIADLPAGLSGSMLAAVVALDEHGEPVTAVSIYPGTVNAEVTLTRDPYSKRVPVRVVFAQQRRPELQVKDYTVSPAEVVLCGDPEILRRTTEVLTDPVELETLGVMARSRPAIKVPQGLISASGNHVQVEVILLSPENGG